MNPLSSWQEEQRSAFLYRVCAEAESGTARAELFRRLAGEAEAQATIWRAQLTARGHSAPPPFAPDFRTRTVAALVRAFGPRPLKAVLAAMKVRGMAIYATSAPAASAGHPGPRTGGVEHRHRGLVSGGNLRAAVFGINDGLVSNASLIPRATCFSMPRSFAQGFRIVESAHHPNNRPWAASPASAACAALMR